MIKDLAKYADRHVRRLPMHLALKNLVRWQPLERPEEGLTVVIGCMRDLWPVSLAGGRLIRASTREHLRELILVFDCTEDRIPGPVREWAAEAGRDLPIRIIGYTEQQARVAERIRWGWVYAWMSWTTGIAAARTRHVLLHDLDAMPLDPTLMDTLYERAVASGKRFHGLSIYRGQGVTTEMHVARTFELIMDAAYVRETFRPFDGFNKVRLVDGRYVDFDTFLWMQYRARSSDAQPVDERVFVHPSQLICQHTDFVAGRDGLTRKDHGLLVLEYFNHLGGDEGRLPTLAEKLADASTAAVPYRDRSLPVGHISPAFWAWSEKQIRRIEQTLFGSTRPEVEAFLRGFVTRAGDARTVGREPVEAGGVEAR